MSTGHAYGYTAVALAEDGTAFVSWLQQAEGGAARVMARAVSPAGAAGPALQVAEGGNQSRFKLAEKKYTVIFHEIANMGHQYLDEPTLEELVRWIDSLDRQ